MSPPHPSGSAVRPAPRPTGLAFTASGYEVVKTRLFIRLQERLEALKARRMPASLLAEAARQQAEQLIETEASRLPPDLRARLAREVLEDAFGFGPLEELFADPAVTEVLVLGTQAVLAKRGQGWLPTNVRFRDRDHVEEVLGKVRAHGEAVAAGLPEVVLDVRAGNGFRAVAVIPPEATGAAPLAAFVRSVAPAEAHPGFATPAPAASASATQLIEASAGGGTAPRPAAKPPGESLIDRHRQRITQRFIAKLAALGVFDLSGIETGELRKVIAAYVDEYCQAERLYLADPDRARVTLEILAGMGR
jgi:hypothetical protein